jgi:hypothetical protein
MRQPDYGLASYLGKGHAITFESFLVPAAEEALLFCKKEAKNFCEFNAVVRYPPRAPGRTTSMSRWAGRRPI